MRLRYNLGDLSAPSPFIKLSLSLSRSLTVLVTIELLSSPDYTCDAGVYSTVFKQIRPV